jgi:hypothetical protein
MGWLALSAVFAIIGIALVIRRRISPKKRGDEPTSVVGLGVLLIVIAAGFFLVGGIKHVPARNIGIPSSFSNVSADAYGPGYHETFQPWLNLTDATETIQTTVFSGCWGQYCTSPNEPRGNCLEVRLGGQQTACVDVTVKWRMNKLTAGQQFLNYANQDNNLVSAVKDNLIIPELRNAENEQLDTYNPILDSSNATPTPVSSTTTPANTGNSQYLTFAHKVEAQVTKDLGNEVTIITVIQPLAYYNASTENFLHQIQNKAAEYQVAIEQQNVNSATKTAFNDLGNPTLPQLIELCLKSTEPHAAGWSCFPGSNSGLAISSK